MSFSEQLIAWRRELHQNPELSGQEVETTARLREWLTAAGIAPLPYDLRPGWLRRSARATHWLRCAPISTRYPSTSAAGCRLAPGAPG